MGLDFYYYVGLQPKMSAGIINEHKCMFKSYAAIIVQKLFWKAMQGSTFHNQQIANYKLRTWVSFLRQSYRFLSGGWHQCKVCERKSNIAVV